MCKQRGTDVLLALVDLKPLIETWRVITGAPKPAGQLWANETMLLISRVVEVASELIPQTVLQSYIILQTRAPTALQWGSLFGSVFAIGFILANASYDIDMSKKYRLVEPTCYGPVQIPDSA